MDSTTLCGVSVPLFQQSCREYNKHIQKVMVNTTQTQ